MKILLINPNTTQFVTDRAVEAARSVSLASTIVEGVTGSFGAPIINSETDMAVGAHCAIDLAAEFAVDIDAVGLAVSFDTGLAALREMLSVPVAGMAESSILDALKHGDRIAIISFGKRTKPLYERLAMRYMSAAQFAGVRCMDALSSEQMQDSDYLKNRISQEVEETVDKFDCDAIVLLATAFAGLAREISASVPVIDAVEVMIKALEVSVDNPEDTSMLIDETWPERKSMYGVSKALTRIYQNFPTS